MNTAASSMPLDSTPPTATRRGFARFAPVIARFLLGLPLVMFGLNAFFNFIPAPETPLPEKAMAFLAALIDTGYMFYLIGVTHLVVGVLLVVNRFVPLALVLFAPFVVNSVVFHASLERSGLGMACVFLALEVYLAWVYRAAFRPMLAARNQPA